MTTPKPRRPEKELPTHIPREASFSLADSHRLLVREFGKGLTPSIATLKRAAASGALKALEAPRAGHIRPRYYWTKLRAHFAPRAKPQVPPPRQGQTSPASPGLAQTTSPEQLAEQLAAAVNLALGPHLQALVTRMDKMEKEVAALVQLRQTLMLKYDATTSAALDRAERLTEQLRETRKLLEVDTSMRKLSAEVARLVERFGANGSPGTSPD